MDKVRVVVRASDPMTYAGLTSYLSSRTELAVVNQSNDEPHVVVFTADRQNPEAMTRLRQTAGDFNVPTDC